MTRIQATVHGAVSIVNAIATRKGATLGIDLQVRATVEITSGRGLVVESDNRNISSRLVRKTVEKIVPKKALDSGRISLELESNIPAGYGLKSSSAISSAVALACARAFRPRMQDRQIILAGVNASIESKVSITGAYDDACSCYYGGFNVTDNAQRQRIHSEKGPAGLKVVIFVPRNRRRGNLNNLKKLPAVFERAWGLALESKYWEAMTINGLAVSSALDSDPGILAKLLELGAYGASVSGNGPAIAAVTRSGNLTAIKKLLDGFEGYVMVSTVNNKKATVHEV